MRGTTPIAFICLGLMPQHILEHKGINGLGAVMTFIPQGRTSIQLIISIVRRFVPWEIFRFISWEIVSLMILRISQKTARPVLIIRMTWIQASCIYLCIGTFTSGFPQIRKVLFFCREIWRKQNLWDVCDPNAGTGLMSLIAILRVLIRSWNTLKGLSICFHTRPLADRQDHKHALGQLWWQKKEQQRFRPTMILNLHCLCRHV
jgi:hypothetical protein